MSREIERGLLDVLCALDNEYDEALEGWWSLTHDGEVITASFSPMNDEGEADPVSHTIYFEKVGER